MHSKSKAPRLYVREHGVYYIRLITPKHLQSADTKRETWHSLRTKDPKQARIFALSYELQTLGSNMPNDIFHKLIIKTPGGFQIDYNPSNPAESRAARSWVKQINEQSPKIEEQKVVVKTPEQQAEFDSSMRLARQIIDKKPAKSDQLFATFAQSYLRKVCTTRLKAIRV